MTKYIVTLVLLLGFAGYCAYAALFFAWVATAPADPENHARASQLARAWESGFFVSLALTVGAVWRMVQIRRAKQR